MTETGGRDPAPGSIGEATSARSARDRIAEVFYRLAASSPIPPRWILGSMPSVPSKAPPVLPPDRPLELEIVSHCWRYHPLLQYQLSSLVIHPPERCSVRMTVMFAPEDAGTAETLEHFGGIRIPGVRWNPWPMPREELFRRAIGRNRASLATGADWIWFTDCDVIFHAGALDGAADVLRDRSDLLCFPRVHGITDLLEPDDPLLREGTGGPRVLDIDPGGFTPEERTKAVGGFQIVRGDVARTLGYCANVPLYQRPVPRWQKTYEDRTFRWILGTHGTPVEIPGLYRIRHRAKGRKAEADAVPPTGV